ncbi:MAG: right-handed parallel beta-helix repeat-containing protein, partial [Thermoanaerobaculia bacterium]
TLPPHTHVQRAEFYPGDWTCTEGGGQVTCTIASLPGKDAYNSFSLELRRDDDAGGFDPVTFSIRSDTPDPNLANNSERRDTWWRRRFHVTTSADAGPGSLRQAILDMNAQCTGAIGCEVFFDLPLPATIEPLTPLPAITGCSIVLDGDADDIVDPLEDERRLMLSGRRLASGNGLDLRPACEAEVPESTLFVAGLAIGDFPWNGIYVAPAIANTTTFLSRVFAGTDMTGLLARPNAARGINVDSPLAYVDVTHAIVSGNHRSGIVVNDSRYASIWSTRIGIARDGSPLPNGASGVYAARGHVYVDGSSHIAHNAHFGAALQRGVQGMIAANYVHSNGGAPIDYGLDGPTPNDAVLPAKPELHDAYYDAATNETVVRLTPPNKTTITIFASRHRADLERPVFFTHLGYPQKPDMEVRIQGDLRGEILTAVAYHYVWGDEPHWLWRSSEASEGVAVR